jgi:hypothetical protein
MAGAGPSFPNHSIREGAGPSFPNHHIFDRRKTALPTGRGLILNAGCPTLVAFFAKGWAISRIV